MAAAVASQQQQSLWQRRPESAVHIPHMSMAGLLPSYDTSPRSVTNPPAQRAFQATATQLDLNMPLFQTNAITSSVPYQSGAFAFEPLAVNPYNMQQAYNVNYQSSMPQASAYASNPDIHSVPNVREARNGFPMLERTPPVKLENSSPIQPSQIFNDINYADDCKSGTSESDNNSTAATFSTDVDTLMKTIQAKSRPAQQRQQPAKQVLTHQHHQPRPEAPTAHPTEKDDEPKPSQKSKKRYQCSMPDCNKSFYQKTHLEIHTRAHTGVKPFLCKEPSCGQRFSQLGNLKTHERRHTGERPYSCDICGKTFAQRGNVRAHKIVHQQVKPFTCRLDDCGKQFTQLGNLKSHQNKFHAATLRYLAQKFSSIREGDPVTAQDKELWEYFAALYKNSNKGIKGRGKDRRISAGHISAISSSSSYSTTTTSNGNFNGGAYQHQSGSDRSSRSSSLSSESNHKNDGYDFNASMDGGFQHHPHGYSDMVFPERKMY